MVQLFRRKFLRNFFTSHTLCVYTHIFGNTIKLSLVAFLLRNLSGRPTIERYLKPRENGEMLFQPSVRIKIGYRTLGVSRKVNLVDFNTIRFRLVRAHSTYYFSEP